MRRLLLAVAMLWGVLAPAWSSGAWAEDYPSRPFRLILAFPPGGTSTFSTAPIIAYIQRRFEVPVNVEYLPGASGNVAAMAVVRAAPDGYTLFFGHSGPLSINHHLNRRAFFDPRQDLAPVTLAVSYPLLITVQPNSAVTSLAELVTYAKTRMLGQELVFGSSGTGSLQHLAGELVQERLGMKWFHVPFAGGGPLQTAFNRGDVQIMVETGSNVVGGYRNDTMRPLAVMAKERLASFPNIPTTAEAGYPELLAEAWFGFLVPGKTPPGIIKRLNEILRAALLEDASTRRALNQLGARILGQGPDEFRQLIVSEDERWGRIVRATGIQPD